MASTRSLQVNIILNSVRLKAFSLRLGTRQEHLQSLLLFTIILETLESSKERERERKPL